MSQSPSVLPTKSPQNQRVPLRNFVFNQFHIQYSNKYAVLQISEEEAQKEVFVENFLCHQVGDSLIKKTCIKIGKKMIVLEDAYKISGDLNSNPQNKRNGSETSTSESNGSKIRSVEIGSQESGQEMRKDKKNIVKNIVKSFENWIRSRLQRQRDPVLEQIKKTLDRLILRVKFNNQLINNIVSNSKINPLFEVYLKEEASIWLENSKIYDKVSHKEAIQCYLRSCTSGRLEKRAPVRRNQQT